MPAAMLREGEKAVTSHDSRHAHSDPIDPPGGVALGCAPVTLTGFCNCTLTFFTLCFFAGAGLGPSTSREALFSRHATCTARAAALEAELQDAISHLHEPIVRANHLYDSSQPKEAQQRQVRPTAVPRKERKGEGGEDGARIDRVERRRAEVADAVGDEMQQYLAREEY